MKKVSHEEIIRRAQNYIVYMTNFCENNSNVKYNKKAVNDFKELQGFMSIYKFGSLEYKEKAYKYIERIFS